MPNVTLVDVDGLPISPDNPLNTTSSTAIPISTPQTFSSAFGEALSANLTPFVQATAVYNRTPANMRTYTATGGTATLSNGEFVCQTGTSVGGYGVFRSVRSVNYKGGMGARFRGTGRFTAGVENSVQGVGFFNVGDGLYFGYFGTEFGIIHEHHGLQEVRELEITAPSSGSTNLTLILNGTSYTIPLTAGTTAHNAFEIEQWIRNNASATWNASQNGAKVIFSSTSDGVKAGVYSFSHGTAAGTITQITAGVTKTRDFTPRASWNIDTCDWIDPTKGNVYQIDIQYLGYGDIFFFVENPSNGQFILCHRIDWVNKNSQPSLGNPSLHCGVFAASLGSTVNIAARSACVASFIQGTPGNTRNPRSFSSVKSVGTALTSLMTIRSREVFGGKANQVEIEPRLLTVFTESARGARVVILTGATLGGDTNFSYLNEVNLVAETSTSETTATGGSPLLEVQVAANSTAVIDLNAIRIRIPPTVALTIAAAVNSGAASNVGAALSWYEDL